MSDIYFSVSGCICLLVCFVEQIPLIGEITWYLSFTDWLISLSIMVSSSIHAIAKGRNSFFLSAGQYSMGRCTTVLLLYVFYIYCKKYILYMCFIHIQNYVLHIYYKNMFYCIYNVYIYIYIHTHTQYSQRTLKHPFKRTYAPPCSWQHYLQQPSAGNSPSAPQEMSG